MNNERARMVNTFNSMSQGCVRVSNVLKGEEMNVLGCQMFSQCEDMNVLGCQMFPQGEEMNVLEITCFYLDVNKFVYTHVY